MQLPRALCAAGHGPPDAPQAVDAQEAIGRQADGRWVAAVGRQHRIAVLELRFEQRSVVGRWHGGTHSGGGMHISGTLDPTLDPPVRGGDADGEQGKQMRGEDVRDSQHDEDLLSAVVAGGDLPANA